MKVPYDSYDYLSYWEDRSFEDCCERVAIEDFLREIGQKETVIDVGGGFGRLSALYSPFFKKCLVVDPSEKLLSIGRELNQKVQNVSFKKGCLPKLPFKAGLFDVALMVRVSHHLPDLSASIKEISRLLNDRGFLILEVANKVHFLARVRAFLAGDFSFSSSLDSVERRSPESIRHRAIAFSNHHPKRIVNELKEAGFSIKKIYSVSNFRSPVFKKIFPARLLTFLEKRLQEPLGGFFFGPSVFILAQKK